MLVDVLGLAACEGEEKEKSAEVSGCVSWANKCCWSKQMKIGVGVFYVGRGRSSLFVGLLVRVGVDASTESGWFRSWRNSSL